MASSADPISPPPAERRAEPSVAAFDSLNDELLREVFLRLPSVATLVRAALTCRAWRRAVASSPSFRRRFRALQPAPLLGLFSPNVPQFAGLVSACRPPVDRDLEAAVRSGVFSLAFFFQKYPEYDDKYSWKIVDGCRGLLLLMNWCSSLLAVVDPLARRSEHIFDLGPANTFEVDYRFVYHYRPQLLFSDEEPLSFRVLMFGLDCSRIRALVFSSDTGEWSLLPWVDVPATSNDDEIFWIMSKNNMRANGSLYWVYNDRRHIVSLDPATMTFSVEELPLCLRYSSFDVGETKDGAAFIVYTNKVNKFSIGVLLRGREDDGVERWVQDRVVPLREQLSEVIGEGLADHNKPYLYVSAVKDGFAYLMMTLLMSGDGYRTPCWFLSLCLETMQLEMLFRRTTERRVRPYTMAFPRCLVGDHGRFALEEDAL